MKLFCCPHCASRVYFENSQCLACGRSVVYAPRQGRFLLLGEPDAFSCLNATECACNWTPDAKGQFCIACSLNRTIPNLAIAGNRERWISIEEAKKRLVYSLLSFELDVAPKSAPDDDYGIAFDIVENDPNLAGDVKTGHDDGLITLNAAEADPAAREKMRVQMGENYRTLLGHFRHEIGHYYWDRLIRDSNWLDPFRALFGDERSDYAQALQDHYGNGPPQGWQQSHISFYAASHPWEDWAETWAHYLHITDTLEMAHSLNIPLRGLDTARGGELAKELEVGGEDNEDGDFKVMLARWLALSEAANSINRCMGLQDFYPFVISPAVEAKLAFVHEVLSEAGQARRQEPVAA